MSKKAVGRVTEAVSAVTAQIEAASDQVVANLQKTAGETIDKFGKVQTKLITPLQEANAMLDELMFDGDNYDGSEEAAAKVASFPVEDRPHAATAAKPQASTLGGPAPVPDWCKKAEDVQA